MKDRLHAFGKEQYSILDNLIFSLRKRQVIKRLPKSPRVIADFGSGYDCRLLVQLLKTFRDANAIGVDTEFHPELAFVQRLRCVTENLNSPLTELKDESIDVGLSLAVLEHLDEPDVFLKELHRVMRPGGVVLLTTPGPTSKPLLEFLAFKLKIIDAHEIQDHKQYFSSNNLKELFHDAGFSLENIDARTFLFGMNNIVMVKV